MDAVSEEAKNKSVASETFQSEKRPENLRMKEATNSRSPGTPLFVAGGIAIAGGIVATLISTKRYPDVDIQNGRILIMKEYNLVYAAAGIVAGGVCIGSGIRLNKKARGQTSNMDYSFNHSYTSSFTDKNIPSKGELHLNLIAYGNELGLRLTF